MFHNSVAVLALSKEPNPTVFQKTLGLNDFCFAGPDFDFPLGNIQMVGKSQAPMFRGERPLETKLAPTMSLDEIARHAVDFWLSTEDLPVSDNRVTLTRAGEVKLTYMATNAEPRKRLYQQLRSMPSIGAVNPALTAMANGLRVGDHLLQRLGATSSPQEAAGAA